MPATTQLQSLCASLFLAVWMVVCCVDGAAVTAVQMRSLTGKDAPSTVLLNAQRIVSYTAQAQRRTPLVDLIVFPEFALFGNLDMGTCSVLSAWTVMSPYCEPLPMIGTMLDCTNATRVNRSGLLTIACGAAKLSNSTIVSFNMCESSVSSSLLLSSQHSRDAAGVTFYNTQAIVQGGRLVTRYRKFHPFYTSCFNTPSLELITFPVSPAKQIFGVFTCYDIMFNDPKQDLVKNGVKFFSYSSAIPGVGRAAVELFALLNNVAVVNANMDMGMSVVVGAGGKVLAECTSMTEDPCFASAVL